METKISSKGQIVIPKPIRNAMGLKTGDVLLITYAENRIVLMPKPADPLQQLVNVGKEMPLRNIRREIKEE